MIAGSEQTLGRNFESTSLNDKYPTTIPVGGGPIVPLPFVGETVGLSAPITNPPTQLPTLNLSRVFVLTGPGTCSASEAIMNGLEGIGVEVIQVGSTTCGKPYGFYPEENCGTTYFTIQFRGVNDAGFGDYTDGFSAQNQAAPGSVELPGCSVADDFDYLHRVMFSGTHTLLDGCGSIFYWRPFSRQIYFEALGRTILAAPAVVAWLHAALLALTVAIFYRALRVTWPGPAACVAATFVLFAESARMLITWPSNFQDLAAMLFAALALHAAAHRRLALALAALALSLFSKEVGVLVALLLPWMPQKGGMPPRERLRWAAWTAGLVAAWGIAYVAVSRSAGLALPAQTGLEAAAATTPVLERLSWALCAGAELGSLGAREQGGVSRRSDGVWLAAELVTGPEFSATRGLRAFARFRGVSPLLRH